MSARETRISRRLLVAGGAAFGLGVLNAPALSQTPEKITYLFPAPPVLPAFGPIQLAQGKGYFKDAGLDVARIEKDMTSPEVKATIEENFKLAEAMGMNGTPSYVIGKQVVVGAIGRDGLAEKIGIARCGKATC